jgi:LDH2 family malate/lactate/ureidoglycolate dehydrogenase
VTEVEVSESKAKRDSGAHPVKASALRTLIARRFTAAGTPPEDAEIVAEVLAGSSAATCLP